MLDARKDAAPVSAIEGLVNDSSNFDVHSIPREDFVINTAQQVQKPALLSRIRICVDLVKVSQPELLIVVSPLLWLILRHLLPRTLVIHKTPN